MSIFFQQLALDIPQLLGQIDVVGMGVLESHYLAPQHSRLFGAVAADCLDIGQIVDKLALFKQRHQQRLGVKVVEGALFPCVCGVKYGVGLACIDDFVAQGHNVGDIFAVLVAGQTPNLLEMRCGDLLHVLADLDLGDDVALLVLQCGQLVNAAEYGLALGGDQSLTDTEAVNACALRNKIAYQMLVEGVGCGDLKRFLLQGISRKMPEKQAAAAWDCPL